MRNSSGVTPFKAETLVRVIVVVLVGAATWAALDFVRAIGGGPAGWILGVTLLLAAGAALFRMRKKV